MKYTMRKRKFNEYAYEQNNKVPSGQEFENSTYCPENFRRIRTKLRSIQRKLVTVFDTEGDRSIHVAVSNENLKLVRRLCLLMTKNSISLDVTNYLRQTPLHLAVMLENVHIVKLLLSFGASPLICDRNGNSVLHLAIKSNCTSMLNVLLSNEQIKSILNVVDHEGYSALHYAVLKNNKEAVEMLHTSGANMNKIDGKSGRTPMIHAVLDNNVFMVDLLLNYGSCPQEADYSGRTALDMAFETENVQLIDLLKKWMPDSNVSSAKEQVKPSIKSSIKMRKQKTHISFSEFS